MFFFGHCHCYFHLLDLCRDQQQLPSVHSQGYRELIAGSPSASPPLIFCFLFAPLSSHLRSLSPPLPLPWKPGNLEIWKLGKPETWNPGNLETQPFSTVFSCLQPSSIIFQRFHAKPFFIVFRCFALVLLSAHAKSFSVFSMRDFQL